MNSESSAKRLKQRWEALAKTERRDYYIASHPGWDDPKIWASRASADAGFVLQGFSDDRLREAKVLEIGCGVGRLVPSIAKRVGRYTGIDIATSCIAEARKRCQELDNTRFEECNGEEIPEAVLDQQYDIIFAAAVFIHCPLDVIEKMIAAAWKSLAPGGEFRFQLRGDLADNKGIQIPLEVLEEMEKEELKEAHRGVEQAKTEGDEQALEEDYMGFAFSYDAAQEMVDRILPHDVQLLRMSHAFIFGFVSKKSLSS
ncbi:MAG: class I SAM-dependent methyltransferase [Planctomycetota bacterium]